MKVLYETKKGKFLIEKGGDSLKVHNQYNSNKSTIVIYEYYQNRELYGDKISKGFAVSVYTYEMVDDYCMIIIFNQEIFKFFLYNIKTEEIFDPHNNNLTIDDLKYSPVIVTGSMGGGTSLVAKLLKYKDIHLGSDSGEKEIRKPHESLFFTYLKEQYYYYNVDFTVDKYKSMINNYLHFFWGENPLDKKWGFKIPNMFGFSIKLSKIFPDAKFVSVLKNSNKNYTTFSGKYFHEYSELQKIETQRPILRGNKIFYAEFRKLFNKNGEYTHMNEMFDFLNIDKIKNRNEYDEILKMIDFNPKFLA